MKTIGLIGGMSWESSAEYYRLINEGMKTRLGAHNNARSLMVTVNFQEIKELQHDGRWDAAGNLMAAAACQLAAGGADFVVLCTNTMHKVAAAIDSAVTIPLLHIADATGAAIQRAGIQRVGLLGTAFTMEQDFYKGRLKEKFGLDVITPNEADRLLVHTIIYDKLCHGQIHESDRKEYQRIIASLQADGAEGVILGCTEIMLLIKSTDVSLPIFDTTQLHCDAAIEMALTSP
ncbi:aspartate/glutamate racemase family protein [Collimonas sp.]|jgi:aspartate racemase|uniref:aspartate/glutamate racemase family protein n=1 Tax=Collimonas sp. TaxID=1963772 RepID=UPI002BD94B2B|nr:aspartate/glutamate racemase family protein [Collimonas sp.]HWW04647.1 aspartate/glutamate racemase family protein [Collimonas sp.]